MSKEVNPILLKVYWKYSWKDNLYIFWPTQHFCRIDETFDCCYPVVLQHPCLPHRFPKGFLLLWWMSLRELKSRRLYQCLWSFQSKGDSWFEQRKIPKLSFPWVWWKWIRNEFRPSKVGGNTKFLSILKCPVTWIKVWFDSFDETYVECTKLFHAREPRNAIKIVEVIWTQLFKILFSVENLYTMDIDSCDFFFIANKLLESIVTLENTDGKILRSAV